MISAASDTVAQTAGSVTITVDRTGGSNGSAAVSYATHNGTAIAGTNYTAASGTLMWNSGDASAKSFAVSLNATAFTGSKIFTVTLANASGAALGSPATATVTITGSGTTGAGTGPAAVLAKKLGLPSRLLLGLGGQSAVANPISTILSQALTVDMFDEYLGTGDWTSWNSPPCDYVCVVAQKANSIGAIPMYTYYQMANNGDGNISVISDTSFMATYWSRIKIFYQDLATYGKPALVNLEPDFWGYAEQHSTGGDPTKLAALVSSNPDCATLPDNVAGVAGCLMAMARKYAPNAYVGFPPSAWGGNTDADVIAFMNAIGAQNADFIVQQTLDRDAGCFEVTPQPSYCTRSGTGWYWDETNQTHPNFQDHLTTTLAYHTGIGNLPVIWWQTPEGVPSATPGGTVNHYRDNRVHYFLTHPAELTAAGGLGVVFGDGDSHSTSIGTDGGQYQSLSGAYFAAPTPLP
jgi:Calx-beta domain-containing protein